MKSKGKLRPKIYDVVFLYLTFIPFAVLGTYSRLGIYRLSKYDPSYITPTSTIWPNIVASFLLGVTRETHSIISIDSVMLPCLTTGFCGTFSSFSSLMLELFQHSTNKGLDRKAYPNAGYGVMEFISVLLVQLAASCGGLILGQSIMRNILNYYYNCHRTLVRLIRGIGYISQIACIPIVASQIALAVIFKGDSRFWTVGSLFGVVGAAVRLELSNRLNSKFGWFPLGTFMCNVISTTIASVLFMLKNGLKDHNSQRLVNNNEALSMMTYLTLGFCGGMSTLSTFVYEGQVMGLPKACIYYLLSIGIGFALTVIIIGSYAWKHNLEATQQLFT